MRDLVITPRANHAVKIARVVNTLCDDVGVCCSRDFLWLCWALSLSISFDARRVLEVLDMCIMHFMFFCRGLEA